jgi:5-methylthioadenosine/S-adenosylhomocysteine deaminase
MAAGPDFSTLVIRGCAALVRPGDLRDAVDIVIAGNRIESLMPTGEPRVDTDVLDGTGLVALPGLINAHTHSPCNCLRGAGEGLPLEVWLARLFGISGRYDPEDHYACAAAGALEMLRTGTTALLDHLWMTPPSVEAAEAVLRAYREAGIRAAVAPLIVDADYTGALAETYGVDLSGALFTDFAPPLPVHEVRAQLEDLVARWHGAQGGRLRIFAGPCGAQWCSDELLLTLNELAERHQLGLHIHLLESRLQVHSCRVRFGTGGVEGLDRLGILGPRTSLAHSVWLEPSEIEQIAERGSIVVHNPSSNLRTGSGRAPVPDLLRAGVRVALGADGPAASDNNILWSQVKLAALIHNDGLATWLGSAEAFEMATAGGAAALGLAGELGTLEPGMLADIVLVDRDGYGLAGVQDLAAGLALSETGWGVRHVIVDGKLVVTEGRCVTLDEEEVLAALREQRDKRHAAHLQPPPEALDAMRRLEEFRRLVLEPAAV